jgi:protein-S-isoprenylcysteine O-methyltransferase Ste14
MTDSLLRFLAALRSAIYATAFLGLWAWLALQVRGFDARLGGELPGWARPLGAVLLAAGFALALASIGTFALLGRGTPAPFDPPRRFVAVGPYRFVRNPMYLGGLAMLAGFGLWRRSPAMFLFTAVGALAIHLFVVLVEEPGLERRFGESYLAYKRAVHRWLPRRP